MTEASASRPGGQEKVPNLEVLRGPNTTLYLARLIQNSVPYSANRRAFRESPNPTVLEHALGNLQNWADIIDNRIVQEASLRHPTNRANLQRMVSELAQRRMISPQMDLLALFQNYGNNTLGRQDRWNLVKALFGIDTPTSDFFTGSRGELTLLRPILNEPDEVHEYMYHLIAEAALKRGIPTEYDHVIMKGRERGLLGFPTTIAGVKANIRTSSARIIDVRGILNIVGLTLDLDVPFLSAVRPLPWKDLSKIMSSKGHFEQEPKREHTSSGSSAGNQQKEGPKEEPKKEYSQNRSSRTEGVDPKDPKGYYKILGVNPDTALEDMDVILQSAYRRLAGKYHPDVGGNEAKMRAINIAYEVLKDPTKRASYGRRK